MKNPKGIRYNAEQMKFLMERESLTTVQKAVNFLLQQYWITYNLVPRAQILAEKIKEVAISSGEPLQRPTELNTEIWNKIKGLQQKLDDVKGDSGAASLMRKSYQNQINSFKTLLNNH